MESVNRKVIFITLFLTIITSLLIYVYISKATTSSKGAAEYVDVIVAAKNLPPKYKITNADIKSVKIDKKELNIKAITDKTVIIGKRVKESILADEQIVNERLIDDENMNLSYKIPEGMRAVSINVVEQVAVSNLVRPGDFVDIIASFDKEESENADSKTVFPRITKTIIQNIEVLSLSQDTEIADEKVKNAPKTVTLAVPFKDVEKLVYASEYGVLRMALRPAEDADEVKTDGVSREDVMSKKGVYTIPK